MAKDVTLIEDFAPPLTIGEAMGVADQIRSAVAVDQKYWPGVIEQLCKQVLTHRNAAEQAESLLRRLAKINSISTDMAPGQLNRFAGEARKLLDRGA
jgi:hypothetical protein